MVDKDPMEPDEVSLRHSHLETVLREPRSRNVSRRSMWWKKRRSVKLSDDLSSAPQRVTSSVWAFALSPDGYNGHELASFLMCGYYLAPLVEERGSW